MPTTLTDMQRQSDPVAAHGRRILVLTALALSGWLAATGAGAREWHFDVSVDGVPIGTHNIYLNGNGATRSTRSDMHFRVSLLGFTAGSYDQHEEETWRADCLTQIDSKTVEKGKVTTVSGRLDGGNFVIEGAGAKQRLPSCVMSFAYWNPRVLKQSRLINVQTGAFTAVKVSAPDNEAYSVRGAEVQARHYRIDTDRNRIDVWYSPAGEWIGLRSTSHEGHVLAYRLR